MTVITDVKRSDTITSVEDGNDLIANALLFQILNDGLKKQREQFIENGQEESQEGLKSSSASSTAVSSTSSEEVSAPAAPQETVSEEESVDAVYYMNALIGAMSAISKNLSTTIDASSERSILLKNLADAAIEQAKVNLKKTMDKINDQIEAQEKAEKIGFWCKVVNYVLFAVTMIIAVALLLTPEPTGATKAAAIAMIAVSVSLLTMDLTGTTDDCIDGLTNMVLWIDRKTFNQLDEEAALWIAMAIYVFLLILVSVFSPMAIAYGMSKTGFAVAATATATVAAASAAKTGLSTANYVAVATATEQAARALKASAEAAKATLTEATTAALQAATKAADAAADAASLSARGLNQQAQAMLKTAETLQRAADGAQDAADAVRMAYRTAVRAADQTMDAANALKNAIGKADVMSYAQQAVKASERAVAAAQSLEKAVEAAQKAIMVTQLASMGGKCGESATKMLRTAEEIKLDDIANAGAKTADDLTDTLTSIMNNPGARQVFMKLSKVMPPEHAAKIVHFFSKTAMLEHFVRLELALNLTMAGLQAALGKIYLDISELKEEMGELYKEKSYIDTTSSAINAQQEMEDAHLARQHGAISKIIDDMAKMSGREWMAVTRAIQG